MHTMRMPIDLTTTIDAYDEEANRPNDHDHHGRLLAPLDVMVMHALGMQIDMTTTMLAPLSLLTVRRLLPE